MIYPANLLICLGSFVIYLNSLEICLANPCDALGIFSDNLATLLNYFVSLRDLPNTSCDLCGKSSRFTEQLLGIDLLNPGNLPNKSDDLPCKPCD